MGQRTIHQGGVNPGVACPVLPQIIVPPPKTLEKALSFLTEQMKHASMEHLVLNVSGFPGDSILCLV